MTQKSKTSKASKTAVTSNWGKSLLNGLPATSRNARKRHADKVRRQAERKELRKEID